DECPRDHFERRRPGYASSMHYTVDSTGFLNQSRHRFVVGQIAAQLAMPARLEAGERFAEPCLVATRDRDACVHCAHRDGDLSAHPGGCPGYQHILAVQMKGVRHQWLMRSLSPPSTVRLVRDIQRLASDRRNTAAAAASSSVPSPRGV